MVNQRQTLVLDLAQSGRRAVAEQMNLRAGFVARQRLRHFQRFDQARRRIGHPARFDGASQQRFLAGLGLFDLGHRGREQHHHAVGITQTVHELERFGARLLEARRRFVGALHRSRGVEDEHLQIAARQPAGEVGPGERENRQHQHQQLKDQQPVVPQPLERRAGLRLCQEFLPEQRAGDEPHHALAFEQIKQDHHRNGGGEPKSRGSQQSHKNAERGTRNAELSC